MAAIPVDKTRPAPTPCSTRSPINTCIEGANAATKPIEAKTTTAIRNIRDTPTESMNGPATTVERPDVTRKAVITQGNNDTSPRSPAMSGSAAETPSAWKEARAAVANMAIDAGRSSLDKTLVGAAVTGRG